MAVRCIRTYRSNRVYSVGEIISNPELAGWVKRDAPGAWEDVVEAGVTPPPKPQEPEPREEAESLPEVVTKPTPKWPGRPRKAV